MERQESDSSFVQVSSEMATAEENTTAQPLPKPAASGSKKRNNNENKKQQTKAAAEKQEVSDNNPAPSSSDPLPRQKTTETPIEKTLPSPETTTPAPATTNQPKDETPDDETQNIHSPSSSTVAVDPVLKELEEASTIAIAATREATTKLVKSAASAKDNLTSFVSSLWSALDSPSSTGTQTKDEEKFSEYLGLDTDGPGGETVLESFRCKLIQPYRPATNTFTGIKQISFSCQLHIASKSLCIELDGDTATKPTRITAKELKSYTRTGDSIKVELTEDRSVVFGYFALPKLEIDSALALLDVLLKI